MNIRQLIKIIKPKKTIESNSQVSNPFTKGAEGRKEWNDRYFNMTKAIRHWQIAFFTSLGVIVLLTFVILDIASQSRVQPFVVEMNKGIPYAVKPMTSLTNTDERLINFAINQFIINTRSVLKDKTAQEKIMNKAYAFSADSALSFLKSHLKENDPRALSSTYIVEIQIVNTLPLSKNTWQVIWDESKKDADTGQVKEVTRWLAQLTYQFDEVNTDFIEDNPFGLYINHITWSKNIDVQEQEKKDNAAQQ